MDSGARLRHFNPWVEGCIATGSKTANVPKRLRLLQRDLAILPLWLEPRGCACGCLLIAKLSPHQLQRQSRFIAQLQALRIGAPQPTCVQFEPRSRQPICLEHIPHAASLPWQPWGWSPHSAQLYSRLQLRKIRCGNAGSSSSRTRRPWFTGTTAQRELYSKVWAAKLLRQYLFDNLRHRKRQRCSEVNILPANESEIVHQCAHICHDLPEVLEAVKTLARRSATSQHKIKMPCPPATAAATATARSNDLSLAGGVVIKSILDGSGRGFIHLKPWALARACQDSTAAIGSDAGREPMGVGTLLRPEQIGAVRNLLKQNGAVVVERWLPVRCEVSAHFYATSKAICQQDQRDQDQQARGAVVATSAESSTSPVSEQSPLLSVSVSVAYRGCVRFVSTALGRWDYCVVRECEDEGEGEGQTNTELTAVRQLGAAVQMNPAVRDAMTLASQSKSKSKGKLASEDMDMACSTSLAGSAMGAAVEDVRGALEKGLSISDCQYNGPLSVDMILYDADEVRAHTDTDTSDSSSSNSRSGAGAGVSTGARVLLKPISEINMRETMGTLALLLRPYVHAHSAAIYTVLSAELLRREWQQQQQQQHDVGNAGGDGISFTLASYAVDIRKRHPLQFDDNGADGNNDRNVGADTGVKSRAARRVICNGVLFLTDPHVAAEFVGVLSVGASTAECKAQLLPYAHDGSAAQLLPYGSSSAKAVVHQSNKGDTHVAVAPTQFAVPFLDESTCAAQFYLGGLLLGKSALLAQRAGSSRTRAHADIGTAPRTRGKKLHILCLHGSEQSASILRRRLRALLRGKAGALADFTFVDAPHVLHLCKGEGAKRTWWTPGAQRWQQGQGQADSADIESELDPNWWVEWTASQAAIEAVLQREHDEGRAVDGLLGFSNGAAAASILLAAAAQLRNTSGSSIEDTTATNTMPTGNSYPRLRAGYCRLRFGIFCSGYIPKSLQAAATGGRMIDSRDSSGSYDGSGCFAGMQSFHAMGSEDPLIPAEESSALARMFTSPPAHQMVMSGVKHCVPNRTQDLQPICNFLAEQATYLS